MVTSSRMSGVQENLTPANFAGNVNNNGVVTRTDLPLTSPVDGLYPYNNRLFDLETEDSILAFCLSDSPDPFMEAFPISTSNVWKHSEAFLTYIGGAGASAGTMGDGTVADACEDPECIEAGYVTCEVEGFGRYRRCGFVRDLRNKNLRYTEIEPVYDIGGTRIEDDFQYDMMRIGSAMMQDINNGFFTSDSTNAGQYDGILQWVTFGYTDPKTGVAHPEMDAYVIDWNDNVLCDFDNGLANDITYNGVTIPAADLAEFSIIDLIRDYLARIAQRIRLSTLSGSYTVIGAADMNLIQCLIDCWVCYRVCGSDVTEMDSFEARQMSDELRSSISDFGAFTMRIDSHTIVLYPWLWDGLYDEAADKYSLFLTVPRVGNRNIWNFEFLDVNHLANMGDLPEYQEVKVTDGGRWAHWSKQDHMCYQTFSEVSPRLRTCAPWLSMIVSNIECDGSIFGRLSKSILSNNYLGMNSTNYNLEKSPEFN